MKITKRQLRRIIREEAKMLTEHGGVIAGVGFGSHGPGTVRSVHVTNSDSSPASLALSRRNRINRPPNVSERYNPAITHKLRRDLTEFIDQYMLGMGMNSGDPDDVRRVRRTIDDVIHSLLGDNY